MCVCIQRTYSLHFPLVNLSVHAMQCLLLCIYSHIIPQTPQPVGTMVTKYRRVEVLKFLLFQMRKNCCAYLLIFYILYTHNVKLVEVRCRTFHSFGMLWIYFSFSLAFSSIRIFKKKFIKKNLVLYQILHEFYIFLVCKHKILYGSIQIFAKKKKNGRRKGEEWPHVKRHTAGVKLYTWNVIKKRDENFTHNKKKVLNCIFMNAQNVDVDRKKND